MFQHPVPYPIGNSSAEPAGDTFQRPVLSGYCKQIACDDLWGYGCHGRIGFRPVDKSVASETGHQDSRLRCQYDGAQKKQSSSLLFLRYPYFLSCNF